MIGRREFITLLGGAAAAWPVPALGQQPAMPVIGFLGAAGTTPDRLAALFRALEDGGYVDGNNLTIEYRIADGQYDRLAAFATDLIERRVAVILASSPLAALTAKAATSTIPVVFISGDDPVKIGLVASLARPGGNVTGFSYFSTELTGKRLELLHELVPHAKSVAVLINPDNPESVTTLADAPGAADKLGINLSFVRARSEQELEAAFATMRRQGTAALLVGNDPFFSAQRDKVVGLAESHSVPAIYENQFAAAGALITYGPTLIDAYRQAGFYVARILSGTKPADLPVQQPTRFVLSINPRTAKELGLSVPQSLLATADEVIE